VTVDLVPGAGGGTAGGHDEAADPREIDDPRSVRWAGPAFALFSLVMVPWTIYLAITLPARQPSPDYDVAWTGFDIMLAIALASTAWFALRRSWNLSTAAIATATLLVIDAWFDCVTSPWRQRPQAIALAVFIELPLAAVCIWLSQHTQRLAERKVILLLRRRQTASPPSDSPEWH
jgi:hypothetical protein